MRLPVLTAVLLLGLAGLSPASRREKRTIGVIFRGLVDAHTRTTPAPKKGQPEKVVKANPPPATVYLIPVPERDKKAEQHLLNAALALRANASTRFIPTPLTSTTSVTTPRTIDENQILQNYRTKYPPANIEKRNSTQLPDQPKQFLIRIAGDEGKAIILRITGEDVKVKKNNGGYMIGVNGQDAKANIKIELPDKDAIKIDKSNALYISPPKFQPYGLDSNKFRELSPEKAANEIYPSASVQPPVPLNPYLAYPFYFNPSLVQTPYPAYPSQPYQQPLPSQPYQQPPPPTTQATTTAQPLQATTKATEEPPKAHLQLTLRLKDEREGSQKGNTHSNVELQSEGYNYQNPEPRGKDPNPPKLQQQSIANNYQQLYQQLYQQQFLQPPPPVDPVLQKQQLEAQQQVQPHQPDQNRQLQQLQEADRNRQLQLYQQQYQQQYSQYYQQPQQYYQQPQQYYQQQNPAGNLQSAYQTGANFNYAQYSPYQTYLQDSASSPYYGGLRYQRTPQEFQNLTSSSFRPMCCAVFCETTC